MSPPLLPGIQFTGGGVLAGGGYVGDIRVGAGAGFGEATGGVWRVLAANEGVATNHWPRMPRPNASPGFRSPMNVYSGHPRYVTWRRPSERLMTLSRPRKSFFAATEERLATRGLHV